MLDQRKREIEKFEELGIPVPTWAGMQVPGYTPASQTITPPEAT